MPITPATISPGRRGAGRAGRPVRAAIRSAWDEAMRQHEGLRLWKHRQGWALVGLDVGPLREKDALQPAVAKAQAHRDTAQPGDEAPAGPARKQDEPVIATGFEFLGHAPHAAQARMAPSALFAPAWAVVVVDHGLHPGLVANEMLGQGGGLRHHGDLAVGAELGQALEIGDVPDQIADAGVLQQDDGAWWVLGGTHGSGQR